MTNSLHADELRLLTQKVKEINSHISSLNVSLETLRKYPEVYGDMILEIEKSLANYNRFLDEWHKLDVVLRRSTFRLV